MCNICVHVTFTVVVTHIKLIITLLFVLMCLGGDFVILLHVSQFCSFVVVLVVSSSSQVFLTKHLLQSLSL